MRDHLLLFKVRIVIGIMGGIRSQVFRQDMGEVRAAEIGDGQFTEDVVNDGSGHLDVWIALDHAVGFKSSEEEGIEVFFQRNAVLQAQRDGDGEAVGHAAEGSAFFMHINEDLTESPILVLASADVNFVVANAGFLRVSAAAVRESASPGDVPMDDFLGDLFRRDDGRGLGLLGGIRDRGQNRRFGRIGHRIQRLAELGAVPVQGIGLRHQLPGQPVSLLDVLNGRVIGHVDGLGDRTADEGLGGRHHANVSFRR